MNERAGDEATPLHLAASFGSPEAINILVGAGADVTSKKNSGFTALHLAASYDKADNIIALVSAGADPNAVCNSGKTALAYAESNAFLAFLLAGADCSHPSARMFTNTNWKSCITFVVQTNTALYTLFSAYKQSKEQLPKHSASMGNPNARNEKGKTLLMQAVEMFATSFVSFLLKDKQLDPNIQDNDGNTALHLLALKTPDDTTCRDKLNKEEQLKARLQICKLLTADYRVNLTIKNNKGQTAQQILFDKIRIGIKDEEFRHHSYMSFDDRKRENFLDRYLNAIKNAFIIREIKDAAFHALQRGRSALPHLPADVCRMITGYINDDYADCIAHRLENKTKPN